MTLFSPTTHALGAAYPVALPVFEGPIDLLLQLIEKDELDISEVSLMAVTDQYLQTIGQLAVREPGALADFLVVASKLLYIKSRNLLPKPQPLLEGEEEDAGDALLKQLLEYRRFKEVALALQEREKLGLHTFPRPASLPNLEKQLDLTNVDVARLHAALQQVLQRIPSAPRVPRIKTYPVTVAEQIEAVRSRFRQLDKVNGARRMGFSALLGEQAGRMEVIVTFLAVLELIKQQEISVVQEGLFGEILLQVTIAPEQSG